MTLAFSIKEHGDSTLIDEQFARAEAFIIYDSEDHKKVEKLENVDAMKASHGAGVQAAALLCEHGVDCVIAKQCGPKAKQALTAAGIKLHLTREKTLEGALKEYDTL